MVGTPGSSILSERSSRIVELYDSRCVSLMSLGEAFPRFYSFFSNLSFILERGFTSVEVLPHTTLLVVVELETEFATQQ
jgi:hypothetical protein